MSYEQFGKVWAVEVQAEGAQGRRIEGLRMQFKVRRSSREAAGAAELELYNAADVTVRAMQRPNTLVRVLAGWRETGPLQVIAGTVVTDSFEDGYEKRTRRTRVQIADGGLSVRGKLLSWVYDRPIRSAELFRRLAALAGVPVGSIQPGREHEYSGVVAYGTFGSEIEQAAIDSGSVASVIDGRLVVFPRTGSRPRKVTALRFAPSSGLIGSPTIGEKGQVTIRAKLSPSMRPGDLYRVESRAITGNYIAIDVEHNGNTKADWLTVVKGRPSQ